MRTARSAARGGACSGAKRDVHAKRDGVLRGKEGRDATVHNIVPGEEQTLHEPNNLPSTTGPASWATNEHRALQMPLVSTSKSPEALDVKRHCAQGSGQQVPVETVFFFPCGAKEPNERSSATAACAVW